MSRADQGTHTNNGHDTRFAPRMSLTSYVSVAVVGNQNLLYTLDTPDTIPYRTGSDSIVSPTQSCHVSLSLYSNSIEHRAT